MAVEPDQASLRARAAEGLARHRPDASVRAVRRLHGGVSSLTYAATLTTPRGEESIVLKVAPPGLKAVHNRDVLRQSRLLRTLAERTALPVPSVVFEDDGDPPMFGMEFLAGQAYEPLTEEISDPPSPEVVGSRGRAAAATLAQMHRLVPDDLGLAGELTITMETELQRWKTLYDSVSGDPLPTFHELHEKLQRRPPTDVEPVLVHGDYRVANMIFDGADLQGIIDWEIWSLGDPRLDLAWLLMHADPAHRLHDRRSQANVAAGEGMPTAAQLAGEYRAAGGTSHDDLEWFLAFSLYKTAATMAAITTRALRRPDPDPTLVVAARSLPHVVSRGLEVLADNGTCAYQLRTETTSERH